LLACGAVDAVGVGKDNKHIMDFEPEEIKRNVTIQFGRCRCRNGYGTRLGLRRRTTAAAHDLCQ
jgi:hypothetical protein